MVSQPPTSQPERERKKEEEPGSKNASQPDHLLFFSRELPPVPAIRALAERRQRLVGGARLGLAVGDAGLSAFAAGHAVKQELVSMLDVFEQVCLRRRRGGTKEGAMEDREEGEDASISTERKEDPMLRTPRFHVVVDMGVQGLQHEVSLCLSLSL